MDDSLIVRLPPTSPPRQTLAARMEIPENREYSLNRTKAIDKKLQYIDREDLQIVYTAGGIRVILNTGMYELLKNSIELYFNTKNKRYTYTCIPVSDAHGNLVETKYKVRQGKSHIYTLNMYHTKCSYLINGRDAGHFLRVDLTEMVNRILLQLDGQGTNVSTINSTLKDMLLQMQELDPEVLVDRRKQDDGIAIAYTQTMDNLPTDTRSGNFDSSIIHVSSQTEVKSVIESSENTNGSLPISESEVELAGDTSKSHNENYTQDIQVLMQTLCSDVSDIKSKMAMLQSEMSEIKKSLKNHVITHEQHTSQLKDESNAIKNRVLLGVSTTEAAVESLSDYTRSINTTLQKTTETLHRKLQSIADYLKSQNMQPVANSSSNNKTQKKSKQEDQVQPDRREHVRVIQDSNTQKPVQQTQDQSRRVPLQSYNSFTNRKKKLIIGDSITKGIRVKGLSGQTEIVTLRGAQITRVRDRIYAMDMTYFKNVVLYIGGNDVNGGKPVLMAIEELRQLTTYLQRQGCSVHLCTLAPRDDTDVVAFNDLLYQMTQEFDTTEVSCIDVYNSFVYDNGRSIRHLYHRDGIHLNEKGSSQLIKRIHGNVSVIKLKQYSQVLHGTQGPIPRKDHPMNNPIRQQRGPHIIPAPRSSTPTIPTSVNRHYDTHPMTTTYPYYQDVGAHQYYPEQNNDELYYECNDDYLNDYTCYDIPHEGHYFPTTPARNLNYY